MCGLFGIAGPGIGTNDLNVLKALMVFSVLRGVDSTGLFTCGNNGTHQVLKKQTVSSPIFLTNNKDLVEDWSMYCGLGHVRDTTVGKITVENAHPFMFEDIVGAHNGTLVDWKYRKDDHRSDSDLLFEDIQNRGVMEVLEEVSDASAYAISIFHRKEYALTFARNRRRPLHIAINKDRGVIYWASEFEMLEFALNRSNIKYDIYEFRAFQTYRVGIKDIHRDMNFDNWIIEDIKPKPRSIPVRVKSKKHKDGWKPEESLEEWLRRKDGVSNDPGPTEYDLMHMQAANTSPFEDDEWMKCAYCSKEVTPDEITSGKVSVSSAEGVPYYTCSSCTSYLDEEAHERLRK